MNYRNFNGLIGYIIELISPPDSLIKWVIVKPLSLGLFYKVSSVIYPEWYTNMDELPNSTLRLDKLPKFIHQIF